MQRNKVLTDKPSQPKRETVVSLAKALNENIDKTLVLAGYAPTNTNLDSHEILDGVMVSFDEKKFTKAEKDQLIEAMKLIAAGIKAQKKEG